MEAAQFRSILKCHGLTVEFANACKVCFCAAVTPFSGTTDKYGSSEGYFLLYVTSSDTDTTNTKPKIRSRLSCKAAKILQLNNWRYWCWKKKNRYVCDGLLSLPFHFLELAPLRREYHIPIPPLFNCFLLLLVSMNSLPWSISHTHDHRLELSLSWNNDASSIQTWETWGIYDFC